MNKLLIHNDNIAYKDMFENNIKLPPIENIDENISINIIPAIMSSDCEIIFIKDNLSTNYLELYGIRVAYHIRLSEELGDKRFLPIVILSDVDSYILNKVEPMSRILFTKNTFLSQSNKEAIKLYDNCYLKPLHVDEYKTEFLDKIQVEQPKDYLSHHSIANEWAMNRWAEYLEVTTDDVKIINEKISSMLYFKYLKAKFPIKKSIFKKHKQEITQSGKILYIDDEWKKGWGSILKSMHSDLSVVEEQYKDKTKEQIVEFVLSAAKEIKPDLVILDIRLHEDDFKRDLEEPTGIEIFQDIKKLNQGIQFIIFTASSDAKLLEELQSYDTNILSYIKKEHPDDNTTTTQGNINKLIIKINEGLEKKYLKEIWDIQKKLLSIGMLQNIKDEKLLELKNAISNVFTISNSNILYAEKFKFLVLSIYKCFEIICDYFIFESSENRQYIAYWKENYQPISNNGHTATNNKIQNIFKKFNILSQENEKQINKIVCTRNYIIHPDNISRFCQNQGRTIKKTNETNAKEWLNLLLDVIKKMNNNNTVKSKKELGSIEELEQFKT